MSLTIGQVDALATKGIESGVRDFVFKNHAYLKRLKAKEGKFTGTKKTFAFNYMDDTQTTGKFYEGAEALTLDRYDPISELEFDLKELEETLVITHRDLAKNKGKEARMALVAERLKLMESAMRQRFTKGLYSDGTAATGALSDKQFIGMLAFLKNTAVNYGGVTNSDVSVHVAYVNANAGVNRALTTALHQDVLGGCSEGENKPTIGIMRQNVMNQFVELLKPFQRTTRESTLGGLGHESNTLVYSGLDHIIDNLSIANAITFLNEENVKLYAVDEYNMKHISKMDLETQDAILHRLFYKGAYCCDTLRYQGILKDITA